MSNTEPALMGRRRRVGWITLVCFTVAIAGLAAGYGDSAWPAAALRISIVLGAIWLCLPTKRRSAVWSSLTANRLAVIVLTAVFINRLKFLLPILVIAGIAAWIIRPRKKS